MRFVESYIANLYSGEETASARIALKKKASFLPGSTTKLDSYLGLDFPAEPLDEAFPLEKRRNTRNLTLK